MAAARAEAELGECVALPGFLNKADTIGELIPVLRCVAMSQLNAISSIHLLVHTQGGTKMLLK